MNSNGTEEALSAVEKAMLGVIEAGHSMVAGHNGGPAIDAGIENIERASELSATAFREAFEECARRAIDAAKANLRRAQDDLTAAEEFADILRQGGDAMASKIEAGYRRASKIASNLEITRAFMNE